MNLKAAEIAWMLAMGKPKDDEEYDVLKQRFFGAMYRMIVRILETPDTPNDHMKEFLSRLLEEPPTRDL